MGGFGVAQKIDRWGRLLPALLSSAALVGAPAAQAQEAVTGPGAPSLNFYGVSGLIDMPSAQPQPDGQYDLSVSHFAGTTRTTLTFQISPRISGSFRYSSLQHFPSPGSGHYYDRSLDMRFQLLREHGYLPDLAIGVQDLAGTGVYSSEYLVATKSLGPRLKVTAGLGWGRLGSYGSIGSPFGPRPTANVGLGGTPHPGEWFRGPMAPFGGIEWQATDRLDFKLEYSSDAYTQEVQAGLLQRRSPWNAGVEYRLNRGMRLGAYYLYGSKVGISLQMALNPNDRPTGGVLGPGPLPIAPRPARATDPAAYTTGWTVVPGKVDSLRDQTAKLLAAQGLELQSLSLDGTTAQLRIVNHQYLSVPQAIGRAARALSRSMPASVSTFQIVPMVAGVPASMVTIRRADLEQLDFAPDNSVALRQRVTISDPTAPFALAAAGHIPRFTWGIGPYIRASLFDPKDPVRADFGLRLGASYRLAPGLILSGAVTKKIIGNLDQSTRLSDSTLPHVRSDANLYDKHGDPALERLQLAWYRNPAKNIYTRVTLGYLERMFGGISAEVLWKPVTSRLALGAELNYVKQRAYNEGLGFRSYKVATGHVSAYYQFNGGYFGEIDAGRYLAGDWGATVTFDRVFANGWRVGAFVTKTNVSAAQFGEGSFDKGLRIQIPMSWALGYPTQAGKLSVIHPLSRDGGARLDVQGRLYEILRSYHGYAISQDWGRVWR